MNNKKVYKIVVVNPGSTSTKIGVYRNEEKVFIEKICHDRKDMERFDTVQSQLGYRTFLVDKFCRYNNVKMDEVDAFAGRGGGMLPCEGGVYRINEKLVYDCETAAAGVHHPAMLAAQICRRLRNKYGGQAFTVNPPDTDEFQDLARISGLKDIYRDSRVHCLNQKEVARRYCLEKGIAYEKHNFIIAHLGGGVSITAHENGRMIDSNDNLAGDGPMTPTRAGTIATTKILKMAYSGDYTYKELENRLTKNGGLIDLLGTDDAYDIVRNIEHGDEYAKLVFDSMIYQFAKAVGECAAVLKGKVDAILITGGLAESSYLTEKLKDYVSWIADVTVMPGEYEVAALASGAYRAMIGEEKILTYTGTPVFTGFQSNKYDTYSKDEACLI